MEPENIGGKLRDLRGEVREFRGEFGNLRSEFRDFRRATTASFNALREDITDRFNQVDNGFSEMRAKFDTAAAGQQQIVKPISGLIGTEALDALPKPVSPEKKNVALLK